MPTSCSQTESGTTEHVQIMPKDLATMDLTIDHQNGYKSFWGPASFPVLTRETSNVVGFDTPELAELLVSSNLSL